MVGYPENVASMKEAIQAIVAQYESHVSQDVLIAQKVHPVSYLSYSMTHPAFSMTHTVHKMETIIKLTKQYFSESLVPEAPELDV